ncbi:winged helix-turn-helix transcriptional regulator [Nocardioides hwasunensis]|uniref:Helix-turn-helix transcriptional regulator n=1 Tax=Nocardioides hwasunensis TaxID=397258 RepID=A0ABR8MCL1_9ACTN|nr:helix-turn-helix domain-containing protein [Nocardioides hwasunensis]MBD3913682.1 helix-turn-helix transcriptional regulator [Nocardioides hwasunensis]
MALGTDYPRQDCGIARSLELVGERWTLLILRDCFLGVRRFSDFQVHLDVSRAVLAARLDALVGAGLLVRVGAGHATYELTAEALDLWPVLHGLAQWGDRRTSPDGPRRTFHHLVAGVACGTIGADGRCRSCDTSPRPGDIETRPGPGADPTLRDDPVSRALRVPHRLLEPLVTR